MYIHLVVYSHARMIQKSDVCCTILMYDMQNRCIQYIRSRLMLFRNLVCVIWFRCEWFEFSVNILNLMWVTWIWIRCECFEFGVRDLNSVWVIWIQCEYFKFNVSDLNLNSLWVIWIRCEWFKFGVHLWVTVGFLFMRKLNNNTALLQKQLRQIETSRFQFATSLWVWHSWLPWPWSEDRKILPAPGTNQIKGFSGYHPLRDDPFGYIIKHIADLYEVRKDA